MKYKNFIDTVNEIQKGKQEYVNNQQVENIYEILLYADSCLIYNFPEYPDITHRQLYDFILTASISDVLDICNYIVRETEFVKNNVLMDNGKIYIPNVTIKDEECNIVEQRGGVWDHKEKMYYYIKYEDTYKFSAWLPITLTPIAN